MLKKKINYLIPIFGFAIIILIGFILLTFDISNTKSITIKDALFTAVSALSCTGLTKVSTADQFTFYGQFVIAVLMEIGALGFIIFVSYFWTLIGRKIKISESLIISDGISSDNISSIKSKSIFMFNLMLRVQLVGVILLGIKFVPQYGFIKGIWYSIFHAISSFANAGFDIIPNNGFIEFKNDIYTQCVFTILMFLGSIGIFAIEDIIKNKFSSFSKMKLQTKIIILSSVIIIIFPTIILKLFEKDYSILNCLFMTVSCRSTGFTVMNIVECLNVSKILMIILMFIGGSPASTAGGIRIVAFAIIIATIVSTLKGRDDTVIFNKKIPEYTIRKSFTVFMIFILLLSLTTIIISYSNNDMNLLNIVFESVSAVTNTGLSITDLNEINTVTDIVLMCLMYIGRVGPLTMMFAIVNEDDKLIKYPNEDVIL